MLHEETRRTYIFLRAYLFFKNLYLNLFGYTMMKKMINFNLLPGARLLVGPSGKKNKLNLYHSDKNRIKFRIVLSKLHPAGADTRF